MGGTAVAPTTNGLESTFIRYDNNNNLVCWTNEDENNNNNNHNDNNNTSSPNKRILFSIPRAEYEKKIDNSSLVYIPVHLRQCGVDVMCRPEVLTHCPSILHDLNCDLLQCLSIMPCSVHGIIRKTKIWVNLSYAYGPRSKPQYTRHSTAHHHEAWLIWARDRTDKTHGIELYNCHDYQKMRLHWNGCGLIMHELCHLIHQFVLKDGLDNMIVKNAYARSSKSGLYDNILRRDWAGKQVEMDMAYAMVDYKEFFAEMSVAYLCDSYHDLDHANKTLMESCCPILMEPTVVQRVIKQQQMMKRQQQQQHENHLVGHHRQQQQKLSPQQLYGFGGCGKIPSRELPPSSVVRSSSSSNRRQEQHQKQEEMNSIRFWNFILGYFSNKQYERIKSKSFGNRNKFAPCNKFYPFTRGQLEFHDPELYEIISRLWKEDIGLWDDDEYYYNRHDGEQVNRCPMCYSSGSTRDCSTTSTICSRRCNQINSNNNRSRTVINNNNNNSSKFIKSRSHGCLWGPPWAHFLRAGKHL